MPTKRMREATVVALALAGLLTAAVGAAAHEERASQFPPGNGEVPAYRTLEEAADVLVVCKPDSAEVVAAMTDASLRSFNEQLLARCDFEHIQEAVEAVEVQRTNIYVLPGTYLEEPMWDDNQPCVADYDGGVVGYDQVVDCPAILALVVVAGDDPEDDDIVCDNQLCHLQIEGTGQHATDTVLRGGFKDDGSWKKHNGIKADRADGFYLRNMTFELFRENAIYVHETDGYVLDRVVARHNDLYGILTFTSDHGLIRDCETHHNGDSGIYPGSAADVNRDNDTTGALTRWAVEITGCKTHSNALGFSGTAGNSVYFHGNEVFGNSAGYVTDSFVPDHPGMPQDHAWLENNRIYANNANYYAEFVHSGVCRERPADRGYEHGTVCPAFPVPVGTGIMIAGGNHNLVRNNDIYDNWRQGVMQFWVPAALRGDFQVDQFDTSNHNHYRDNRMGRHPDGFTQPNGVDFWWDDQGTGNCWQGNTSHDGEPTHNATSPLGLPDCDSGGSVFAAGNAVKSAGLVPCATYDREDNPDPEGCDWFESPEPPEGREEATTAHDGNGDGGGTSDDHRSEDDVLATSPTLPATGAAGLLVVVGAALAGSAAVGRRRRGRAT